MRLMPAALALLMFLPFAPRSPSDAAAMAPSAASSVSVRDALAYCRAHPAARTLTWLEGWFIPTSGESRGVPGLLFQSPAAVPLTTVNNPGVDGHWRRYGAIFATIHTTAGFSARRFRLHGPLDCATASFQTDRDPLPPPRLTPTYSTTQRGANGPIATSAIAGGLQMTLTVPHATYPRNALVQVRVSLRNVSTHDIGVLNTGEVQVLGPSGAVLFPPVMPYFPAIPGPPPSLMLFHPGATAIRSEYVILRGARIRATQPFTPTWNRSVSAPRNTLSTGPITVRLTAEGAPRIVLHTGENTISADMIRPPGLGGSPLIFAYTDCGFPSYQYASGWVPSPLHLTPGCSPVSSWHVRLAWPNHPVAGIDYTAPMPVPTPTPTATATPSPSPAATGPSLATILRRAARAMSSIHALHAEGLHTSADTSPRLHLRMHSDCRSAASAGLPIHLRTLTSGRYTEAGHITTLSSGYIIEGPVIPQPHSLTRTRERSAGSKGRWQPANLHKEWRLDESIDDPVFGVNPAYTNQTCADLLRLTYLTAPLPSPYSRRVLGLETLGGHRVWHLREALWFKLDLYIDATSYRLVRLRLWDAAGPANSWQIRFDYSRFNSLVTISPAVAS